MLWNMWYECNTEWRLTYIYTTWSSSYIILVVLYFFLLYFSLCPSSSAIVPISDPGDYLSGLFLICFFKIVSFFFQSYLWAAFFL